MSLCLHSHISREDAVDEVLLGQVEGALQLVVVEGDLSGARAIEPRLHECGPGVLQQKSPAYVVLADSCHSGIDSLATVVLYRVLPQEEEGEEADVISRDEVGLCQEQEEGEGEDHYIETPGKQKYLQYSSSRCCCLDPCALITDCNKNFKILPLHSCLRCSVRASKSNL